MGLRDIIRKEKPSKETKVDDVDLSRRGVGALKRDYTIYKEISKDTIQVQLENILKDLKLIRDVEACAVVSRSGLLMAIDIQEDLYAETFAAMSAAMLDAAESALLELKKGAITRVIAESNKGKLLAVGAGKEALLVVMTSPHAGLGLVLVEMEKAVEKIKEVL